MTAEQKLKWLILKAIMPELAYPCDNIDELWSSSEDELDELYDAKSYIRSSGIMTGLSCEGDRHYDSEAVAAKLPDGSWVGWTYFSGGGKWGNEEEVEWIETAHDVVCKETFRMCSVLDFSAPVAAVE